MELFGPTIQGEGMVIGRKSMFVRTAGCDYQCVWCDSAFTWDGSEKHRIRWMDPQEVLDDLLRLGGDRFNHVTISGGNPALIGDPMGQFIHLCHQRGIQVGLETQGSRMQPWFSEIDDLTLSPKPPSSTMETNFSQLDALVSFLEEKSVHFSLKIVVFDDEDLDYARHVFARYPGVTEKYIQPGNGMTTATEDISSYLLKRLEWLFNLVINDPTLNNVRVLPQLHALVWSNKRAK